LLASAQAVAAHSGDVASEKIAELIEEIGYAALGRSHDLRDRPRLNACRSLGRMAATLHDIGYIHGDLQPQNFSFKEDGEIASMFDLGRTYNPGRPLTLLERASDLAVLKKNVSFLEWEAAKFGYRAEASDAEEVLAQFE
jgi:tRNA A-37 threonylcarbamoyl transferase component Bud32